MKKEIKATVITAILAIGLMAGAAIAQAGTDTSTNTQQQPMSGNMMNGGMNGRMMQGNMMQGGGMMHGNMMDGNMMDGNMMGWQNDGGMGCNGMMGGMMMNTMTPGQQQEFMNQTVELRKQMMEQRFTYMEAMRNPNTSPDDLAKIEKGMLELRIKMMDKMNNVQKK